MKKLLIIICLLISSVAMAAPSDTTVANNISVGQNAVIGGNMNVNGVSYMAGAVMSAALNLNNQNINFIESLGDGNLNINADILMNGNINMNGSDLLELDELHKETPASDIATTKTFIYGQHAFPTAATNVSGGDLVLAGSAGRAIFTVVTAANCGTDTMSVYVSTKTTPTSTTLTCVEGSGWTKTDGDNTATAASLATCINNLAGVGATSVGAVVYLSMDDGTLNVYTTTSDATCATTTMSQRGGVVIAGAGLSELFFGGTSGTGIDRRIESTTAGFAFRSTAGGFSTVFTGSVTSDASITFAGTGYLSHSGRSRFYSSSDGKHNLTNTGATGYTSLTLGLETNAFPSLVVNGAALDLKLGDGSAWTDLKLDDLTLTGDIINPDDIYQPAETTDTDPGDINIHGGNAYSQAVTNVTGGNLTLNGGIGKKIFTIADYSQCSTRTLTVFTMNKTTLSYIANSLIENTAWFMGASNNDACVSLASAIEALSGVSATCPGGGAIVYITADSSLAGLDLSTNAAGCATVTESADGGVVIPRQDFISSRLFFGGLAATEGLISYDGTNFLFRTGTASAYRSIYGLNFIGSGYIQAAASSYFGFSGRSEILSSADGKHNLLNDANSGYTSLTLGLETNAFAGIFLNATTSIWDLKLGDGSDWTQMNFKSIGLRDVTNPSHILSIVPGSDLTADHTFTLVTGDADTQLSVEGTASVIDQDLSADSTTAAFGVLTLGNTGLHLLDTNASHDLILAPGSDLTADHTLTLTTGDADRTITLSGNPTLDDWFNQSVKSTDIVTHDGVVITQEDVGATCTLGQLRYDTGGDTDELCYCQATNTWMCAAMAVGPVD